MSLITEFKEFASKGNVVDLAVGVIMGAAFGKVVSSLVADVIMPPLGVIVGGANFTGLKIILRDAAAPATPVTLNYGNFMQTVLDFTIVSVAIFLLVKAMNRLRRKAEAAPPAPAAPSREEALLAEIRDILRNRS